MLHPIETFFIINSLNSFQIRTFTEQIKPKLFLDQSQSTETTNLLSDLKDPFIISIDWSFIWSHKMFCPMGSLNHSRQFINVMETALHYSIIIHPNLKSHLFRLTSIIVVFNILIEIFYEKWWDQGKRDNSPSSVMLMKMQIIK